MFRTFPAPRLRLQDEDLVRALAAQVVAALRNAIAGRPAGEQPLAVGLIGAPRQCLPCSASTRPRATVRSWRGSWITALTDRRHAAGCSAPSTGPPARTIAALDQHEALG
jgi:hypothetical protein